MVGGSWSTWRVQINKKQEFEKFAVVEGMQCGTCAEHVGLLIFASDTALLKYINKHTYHSSLGQWRQCFKHTEMCMRIWMFFTCALLHNKTFPY